MQKNHKPDFAFGPPARTFYPSPALDTTNRITPTKKVTEAEMIGQESGIRLT